VIVRITSKIPIVFLLFCRFVASCLYAAWEDISRKANLNISEGFVGSRTELKLVC
jgi:hypothetical protein